jgi:signal transduction histidine kinase
MSTTDRGMQRAALNEIDVDAASAVDVEELLSVLAHELRNPLASMQGCAQTLLDRGGDLSQEVRGGLAEVIVRHAQRMDWLIRATALLGSASNPRIDEFDLDEVVREAASMTGAEMTARASSTIVADRGWVRLAVEALLLALGPSGRAEVGPSAGLVRLTGGEVDLRQGGRLWKLHLARRAVQAMGGALVTYDAEGETVVELRFVDAGEDGTPWRT